MSRMTHARYRNETEPISAFDVDDNYDLYSEEDRREFRCIFCDSQIQFSRGKAHDDPHFKNWPLKEHGENCKVPNSIKQLEGKKNEVELQTLVSTILPRAMRPSVSISPGAKTHKDKAKRYVGKQTRKFIYDLKNVLDSKNRFAVDEEYKDLTFLTEANDEVKIEDIIMTQDKIINALDSNGGQGFICILKGTVSKVKEAKGSYIVDMTKSKNGIYGNSKGFKLYMPYDFVSKNESKMNSIKNSLIICYGIASKTDYGYQMDLYSIKNQVAVLMTFT
ncbi:hypothetical protein SH1V18_05640 [Vallitalea longa]|uniref:Uncharacterized protein n=1 Tax=Vallitalea longa TaxID=2936439 RepID=A0A9W6DEY4_9FIRM|nr:hypothetical protein [Vallitalea longa]GKX28084.1 hypothetical protein SH1V18_05640 [Vallitalea longa]